LAVASAVETVALDRPELASSGATMLCLASCASVLKRSIGPIWTSSFAAVTGPIEG
jgi:hypothetical protein